MTETRKTSLALDPESEFNIIRTFQLPWIHKVRRIMKDSYYSLEGVWYMTSSENIDKVLRLVGAGPRVSTMVLNSNLMLLLMEDIDFGWWIQYEYCFEGKTRSGYKARAYKMTSNKFWLERKKPEVLEDWAKR